MAAQVTKDQWNQELKTVNINFCEKMYQELKEIYSRNVEENSSI